MDVLYLCPGQTHSIERAQHLARLAAGYPECRQCAHRADPALSVKARAKLAAPTCHRAPDEGFHSEGIGGVVLNQLDAPYVARIAMAAAVCCRHEHPHLPQPTIVLGGDERPILAELFAAACQGLRRGGCRVVDLGGVTTGSLAWGASELRAQGALLIAHASGKPHAARLSFWGERMTPWSSPGRLDRLRRAIRDKTPRPVRRSGPLERWHPEPSYLEHVRPSFHAFRPLRLVFDTASIPLARQLAALMKNTGVAVEPVSRRSAAAPSPEELGRSSVVATNSDAAGVKGRRDEFADGRLLLVQRIVRERQADLGVWVDGAGERLRLVDERGEIPSTERVAGLLADEASPEVRMVVGGVIQRDDENWLRTRMALSKSEASTAESIVAAMQKHSAAIGCDDAGRIWLGVERPAVDALAVIGKLLARLSQSDRPPSAILDQTGRVR